MLRGLRCPTNSSDTGGRKPRPEKGNQDFGGNDGEENLAASGTAGPL